MNISKTMVISALLFASSAFADPICNVTSSPVFDFGQFEEISPGTGETKTGRSTLSITCAPGATYDIYPLSMMSEFAGQIGDTTVTLGLDVCADGAAQQYGLTTISPLSGVGTGASVDHELCAIAYFQVDQVGTLSHTLPLEVKATLVN